MLALSHSPAEVIRKLLVALGLGTFPAASGTRVAWSVYAAGEPDAPDSAITVYGTAGRTGARTMPDGERDEHHGVQIRVRAAAHTDGFAKARAVAVALDQDVSQVDVAIGSSTYLVHSVNRTSDVLSLGKDPASKRHLFTINALTCIRKRPL